MIRYLKALILIVPLLLFGQEVVCASPEFDPIDLESVEVKLQVISTVIPRLPFLMEIIVSNRSTQDIDIPMPTLSERDNPYNTLDIFYKSDGVDEPKRVQFAVPTFAPWKEGLLSERPELMHLQAEQSWTVLVPISYDWHQYNPTLIVDTGILYLSAKLYALERDQMGEWVVRYDESKSSDTIEVKVYEPTGDDAAALSDLMCLDRPWLLSWPKSLENLPHGNDFHLIQDLVNRPPESLYDVYAKAALAYMLAFGDRLDLNPSRPPDRDLAIQLLDEVLQDPRFVLRDQAIELKRRLESMVAS